MKTNQQFVQETMNFSHYGALAECFILDAILKHARAVAAQPKHEVPESTQPMMVHWPSWVGVAQEIKDKIEKHLEMGDKG